MGEWGGGTRRGVWERVRGRRTEKVERKRKWVREVGRGGGEEVRGGKEGVERRQGSSHTLKSLFWVSSSTIVPAFLQIVSSSSASATGWTGAAGFRASPSGWTGVVGFWVGFPVISFKALMAACCSFWLSG